MKKTPIVAEVLFFGAEITYARSATTRISPAAQIGKVGHHLPQ